jgi:hypothetical protein
MFSSVAGLTAKLSVRIVVLAAFGWPSAGLSQPAPESAAAERQRQIAGRIEQEEATNGPNAEGLISPLSALALLYRESGDERLAVAVIERIRHRVRVNYGLHSLEQAPLIRQLIASEEAFGNYETAWNLEQELVTLARRHPADLRIVPILREVADKRLDILRRFLAGEAPPQIILGCYYAWPRRGQDLQGCRAGTRSDVARALVSDVQGKFADAIGALLHNELYASDELRELELEFVRASDQVRELNGRGIWPRVWIVDGAGFMDRRQFETEPWRSEMEALARLANWALPDPHGAAVPEPYGPSESPEVAPIADYRLGRLRDYRYGRLSLERLYAYEVATSSSLTSQIDALVRIPDWELLYSENRMALDGYELIYRMLEETGDLASIDRIFAPEIPVVLPSFSANPLARAAAQAADGYVDIAFEITRFGISRAIRVLDTRNASDAARDEVVRLVRRSRFRPRVTDGQLARRAPVVVRYYLSE